MVLKSGPTEFVIDSPALRYLPSLFSVHHSHPQDMPSILDWPLPQPAYDEVTTDLDDQSEDQEVRSINKKLTEETAPTLGAAMAGRSESQSADLFQELQREVGRVLHIVSVY